MKNLSTPARVYVLGVIIAGGILAALVPQLPGAAPRLDLPFAVYVANGALVTLAITLVAGKPFRQVGVISRSSFYREMVLIWLGAAVADFWIVNPWRTVLLTLPLVGLSQMLRLQIEDAERIRRSQQEAEGRAQQLASLNELARALTSSLELEQVCDALYAQIRKVVPADAFGAGVYEPHADLIRFSVWRTEDETFPAFTRNASEPIFRRVLQARTPLALEQGRDHEDIAQLSQYGRLPRDAIVVAIPMTVGDRAVGMIIVGTRRALTPQEMDLLSTMASQTAVAMEKAQLFDRERRKSAQLSAITQVSKKIVTIHSVDVLLQQTSRLIEETFAFERVQVLLADEAETAQADPAATDIPVLYRGESIGDLRVIEKEALRARAIVRDLLGYARQTDSAMEQTRINEALESVLPLIRRRAEAQHVSITANFDPSVPQILGDVNQLKQVFINILNNAIDAMPAGGVVEVSTREVRGNGTGPQVEIAFQDSGVGIPEDRLERIFDPFFTTKEDGKGTGLGRPLSKRIVARHCGSIAVKSVVGAGTRFTVALPVAVTYS